MNIAILEQEILNDALEALRKEIKINIEKINLQAGVHDKYDAVLELRLFDCPLKFNVEIKANTNNINLGNIANQMRNIEKPALLVTKFVNPQLAGKLRGMGIPFVDTAGNAFINLPPVYIWMTGNKIEGTNMIFDRNIAWGQAQLRVIFALLCHPGLENKNYRAIAREANTALGTVNRTFRNLTMKKYLVEINNNEHKLVDKRKLLDRWVELYAEKLRTRTLLGRYKSKNDLNGKQLNLAEFNAQWGGEVAAERLTGYLRPGEFTVYTDKTAVNELIYRLRLVKNPEGNVELRQRFWGNDPIWGKQDTVHPILIYADLLATAEPRNIETARIIYDRYVTRYIK